MIAPKNLLQRAAKLLLAIPLLGLLAFASPEARADDHKNRQKHHGDRNDHHGDRNNHRGDRGDRGNRNHFEHQGRHYSGYNHNGRYYRHRSYHRVRHSRYSNGRRVYYYVNEPYYYGLLPGGISVNFGL